MDGGEFLPSHPSEPQDRRPVARTRVVRKTWFRLPAIQARSSRASRFLTFDTCHRPPRRVFMPRAFSSAARARRVVWPWAWRSAMTGARACGVGVGVGGDGLPERHSALAGPSEGGGAVGVAEPGAAGPGGGQRLLRAAGDRLAFGLGDQRHDADGQVVGLGHVDGEEGDAAVAQGQQEGGVAAQAVEAGDDQGGAGELRQVQRLASSGRSRSRPLSTSVKRARTAAPRDAAKASIAARWASRPRPLAPCRAVETRS